MRFLSRFLGFILLVTGFVTLIVDGTRAIADESLTFTSLGPVLAKMLPSFYPQIEPLAVKNVGSYLWDPVLVDLFGAPAFVVSMMCGVILLWVGRPPVEPIGFST